MRELLENEYNKDSILQKGAIFALFEDLLYTIKIFAGSVKDKLNIC